MNADDLPTGHLAVPAGGAAPAVLVLHAWWGLTDGVRVTCDRLADAGFAAGAPDLYGDGRTATTEEEADALRRRRRWTPTWRIATAWSDALAERSSTGRLGVVGFSMGGHWAVWLSQHRPVAATVLYYAARAGDFGASTSRYLVHAADEDRFVSDAALTRMERALVDHRLDVTVHRYPGTGHWFAEADRPEYDPAAAGLAWRRTLRFLRATVGP